MKKNNLRIRRAQKTKHRIKRTGIPAIVVSRSINHIYAQVKVLDPKGSLTVAAASTLDPEIRAVKGNKTELAKLVGTLVAKRAIEKGYKKLAFDRNGLKYHGRVMALANGAREAGLEF